ncbi:MAG TPA: DUF6644 family protein [Vicinamibacterales bacterium]|nr:DUF6644 family protein [Vicinamibacterales bacterium]
MFDYFHAIEFSAAGQVLKNSPWAFAVTESVHLLALSVIGGALLAVDLRMLGLGLRRQKIPELASEMQPILVASLIVMLLSGAVLFTSEAVKCYYSYPFWVKMSSLALAILFTFTVRRKVTRAEDGRISPIGYRTVALVSLALWFAVGAAGRWIGFSG